MVVISLVALIFFPSLSDFGRVAFLNRTASMPIGLYAKIVTDRLILGDIVVFNLGTIDNNLLKYIAGLEGDEYCSDIDHILWINGLPVAKKNILKYDSELISQSVCQKLKQDEFLVLGEHPDSYDSRYFGPIKKQDVIAQVKLIFGR